MLYDWIKALHVISMIAWMAGLLYLPRLFVYHVQAQAGSIQSDTFKIMERRLLKAIMNPAMIASFVFGIWLIVLNPSLLSQGWLHAKLLLVLGMAGAPGALGQWRQDLVGDRNVRPQRFYRIANEVPTVLMIVVVILVIVRPF
jgi:putative membrane protein